MMITNSSWSRARAPGKVVISGAYAVLHGAPALVAAVDRYVTAYADRAADFITPEVQAAMPPPYPAFDASPLRHEGRKLGLGSSAAILAASLAVAPEGTLSAQDEVGSSAWREALFQHALAAHRNAQGGGSGIDVAASVYGGVLEFRLLMEAAAKPAVIAPIQVPNLVLDLWAADRAASTSEFVAKVNALQQRDSSAFHALMDALKAQAFAARDACHAQSSGAFITALSEQSRLLAELGKAAEIAIVTPELAPLIPLAQKEGAALLPAGAGGGDIALYVGLQPASASLLAAARASGHAPLAVAFGAPGVHTF